MKIAILSINIGRYIVFWKEFYETAEKNFFPDIKKDYYVFTDQDQFEYSGENNVHKVYQKNLGWPGNTLMRYHMFSRQREELIQYDYLFFVNSNCVFIERVGDEILPKSCEKYVFCRRPNIRLRKEKMPPYEKNPKSTAYVEDGNTKYVQGGFWGGESIPILDMCDELRKNIDVDSKNGIVAIWHDESHLNRFSIDHPEAKTIGPSYQYPEEMVMPFPKRIMNKKKTNTVLRYGKKIGLNNFKMNMAILVRNTVYVVLMGLKIMKYEDD